MATSVDFVCDSCARTIEAWDEGNPYYFDGSGEKHYAYHPDPERGLCTGVDNPHVVSRLRGRLHERLRSSDQEVPQVRGAPHCPHLEPERQEMSLLRHRGLPSRRTLAEDLVTSKKPVSHS